MQAAVTIAYGRAFPPEFPIPSWQSTSLPRYPRFSRVAVAPFIELQSYSSGQLVRVNFIKSDIRSGWEKVRLVVSDALTPRPDSNHLLSSPLTISCCPNRWHLESWLAEDRFLNSFYLLTKTPRNWRLGQNSAAGNQITAA